MGLLANAGQTEVQRKREGLVFHFPHYQGDSPHTALLLGNFKLIHFYEDDRDVCLMFQPTSVNPETCLRPCLRKRK